MTTVDEIDVAILAFVSDHKKSSVTDGAKALYKPSDVYELQKKDAMLRHRYKALADRGLLIPKEDGRRTLYSVDKKKIKYDLLMTFITFLIFKSNQDKTKMKKNKVNSV